MPKDKGKGRPRHDPANIKVEKWKGKPAFVASWRNKGEDDEEGEPGPPPRGPPHGGEPDFPPGYPGMESDSSEAGLPGRGGGRGPAPPGGGMPDPDGPHQVFRRGWRDMPAGYNWDRQAREFVQKPAKAKKAKKAPSASSSSGDSSAASSPPTRKKKKAAKKTASSSESSSDDSSEWFCNQ